jgi:hypothetical protein
VRRKSDTHSNPEEAPTRGPVPSDMAFRSGLWVCGVFGFFAAVGCGGDDDEDGAGAGSLESGVAEAKPVGELSSAETDHLCKAFHDYAGAAFMAREEDILRVGCTMALFFSSLDAETCEARVDECVAQATETSEPEVSPVSCAPTGQNFGSCTATVGELEACMKESIDTGLEVLLALDCQRLIEAVRQGAAMPGTAPLSPACQVVARKCPGALQGTGLTDGI